VLDGAQVARYLAEMEQIMQSDVHAELVQLASRRAA
jgi:hypothetical protein